MFGSKKIDVAKDGAQALAVVMNVEYAKVLGGMTVARNYNYKLDLSLMVKPDNEAPFEAHVQGYFSQFAQPSTGDQFYVRYDPSDHSRVEIDEARIAASNAAVEAQAAAAVASALPPDLAAAGIPGRASVVDVQKTPTGTLVDCEVTVSVRLVDGRDPYRTTCHVVLSPADAEGLRAGGNIVTVRADPDNQERVALSLTEETPVVTVTDPASLDPPQRALRDGEPCTLELLLFQRQWLATPAGDELYATKVKVVQDGSELQAFVPVPAGAVGMLRIGAQLPGKRLRAEPNVLTVDWSAALAGSLGA